MVASLFPCVPIPGKSVVQRVPIHDLWRDCATLAGQVCNWAEWRHSRYLTALLISQFCYFAASLLWCSQGAKLMKWPREQMDSWGPWFLFWLFYGEASSRIVS
jgi:hypothetical protein